MAFLALLQVMTRDGDWEGRVQEMMQASGEQFRDEGALLTPWDEHFEIRSFCLGIPLLDT